jgi:hypothetical protein
MNWLVLATALGLSPPASATEIPIVNASFEDSLTGWSLIGRRDADHVSVDTPTSRIPYAEVPAGNYVATLESEEDGGKVFGIRQLLSEQIKPNTTYRVVISVGCIGLLRTESLSANRRKRPHVTPGFRVELRAEKNTLARKDDANLPFKKFKDVELIFTTDAKESYLGKQMEVLLMSLNNDSYRSSISFDDIRIYSSPAKPNSSSN